MRTKKGTKIDLEENIIIAKLEKEKLKLKNIGELEQDLKYQQTKKMLDSIRGECRKFRKINDNRFFNNNTGERIGRHDLTFELLKKAYDEKVIDLKSDSSMSEFFLLAEIIISLIEPISIMDSEIETKIGAIKN